MEFTSSTPGNDIGDVLFSAAQSAALGLRKEAPGIVSNSSARPAGILLPNWSPGRVSHFTTTAANLGRGCWELTGQTRRRRVSNVEGGTSG